MQKFIILTACLAVIQIGDAIAECKCDETDFVSVANNANRIFVGRIVQARVAGEFINIEVKISDVIRGLDTEFINLKTPTLEHCGMPVVVGYGAIFFIKNDDPIINRCSSTNHQFTGKVPSILQALWLAHYPGGYPMEYLGKVAHAFYEARTEEKVIAFFDLVSKLQPYGTSAIRTPNGFLYRDFEVLIENGKFKRIRPLSQ